MDKDGFPTCIGFLKEFCTSMDTSKLRFTMTLLVVSRSIRYKGTVNYSSVTDPFKGDYKTIDSKFIERFVKDYKIDLTHDGFNWSSMFFTFKGGVYGKQIVTALQSLGDWSGPMHAYGL